MWNQTSLCHYNTGAEDSILLIWFIHTVQQLTPFLKDFCYHCAETHSRKLCCLERNAVVSFSSRIIWAIIYFPVEIGNTPLLILFDADLFPIDQWLSFEFHYSWTAKSDNSIILGIRNPKCLYSSRAKSNRFYIFLIRIW